jgi:hypothetical protein
MFKRERWLALLITGGLSLVTAGAASAAVDKVICVPWQGDVIKQHTAISGQAAQLKCVVKTTDTSAVYARWDYLGDGSSLSAVTTLSGSTKYNVATSNTYTAANETPFTAKLQVSNTTPFALSMEDTYLLKIQADEINARINIAIDTGLWWLYTHGSSSGVGTYDGSPAIAWYHSSYVGTYVAPTASAVHAFGINNHKVTGDPDQDPYVETVQRGINFLVKGYSSNNTSCPALQAVNIASSPPSHGGVADSNGNGYGIQAYGCSGDPPYQGGQVMDAIIASGMSPGVSTGRDFGPAGHLWTYGEVLQDMADMYAWGQNDAGTCNGGICGSWWYGWNYGSPGDNSASQWGAIGLLPAQEAPWNATVPQWVKDYNANWLAYSMGCTGPSSAVTACTYSYFSYNGVSGCAGDSCEQTTPSGMTQMVLDGQTTADLKWTKGQRYMADRWRDFTHAGSTWGSAKTYGWYSFAKAMRLAKPSAVTQLTKTSGRLFDWYYGNTDPAYTSCTNEANCEQGLAPRILEVQTKTGANTGAWEVGNFIDSSSLPLTTAWMIITLRPTVFAAAPIACFSANPNPGFKDLPISFDPSCSGHSETGKTIANLKKFEWDWNNDGVYDQSTTSPSTVPHAFACASLPCTYPVTLRVTDDNNPALTATTMVNINITNPPHPPVANAGGPYMVSMCAADTLALDGSKSFDQDAGLFETGCTNCPPDGITAYDWDLVAPLTFASIDKTGMKPTLSAAEILATFTAGSQSIGLRVTDNTALAYPSSGSPNLTNAAFGTVDVRSGCMCNLAGRAKGGKIALTWAAVAGAGSYDIYRSTSGPNTGFTKIATTTTAGYMDASMVKGTQYYYRVVASTGCGSNALGAKGL